LSSAYDVIVPARGKALVKTDIAIAIPPNTYARIGITLIFKRNLSNY
jgi:dUTP pyrophosphatase